MAEKTASLTVLGGPLAGTRCVLPETGTVTIGSSPDSTLPLDLPTVAPFHARVEVEAGRVTVHDTGAERTVHVNDNPLDPDGTVLRNGDILWLGVPGEDEVVMLQCVLPRRPVEAPSPVTLPATPALPPSPPGPATPTPDIETQALWSFGETPSPTAAPRVAAEPVREEPTGTEETMAILPEGFVAGETPLPVPATPEEVPLRHRRRSPHHRRTRGWSSPSRASPTRPRRRWWPPSRCPPSRSLRSPRPWSSPRTPRRSWSKRPRSTSRHHRRS